MPSKQSVVGSNPTGQAITTNDMNDIEMYLIECGLNADERNTVLAMVHDYTTEFLAWQESDRND